MNNLEELLRQAKLRLLKMHFDSGVGHVGGNLSSLDVMLTLHHRVMGDGDQFVLSKGHAAGALYVTLWSLGRLAEEELQTFHRDHTRLGGHPVPNGMRGVPFGIGSLGHGLGLAAGLALGRKLRGQPGRVFCLLSDGEWNEGSTWEALTFIAHRNLRDVVPVVDVNGLQGFGYTADVANLGSLARKLREFGVDVRDVDGHDAGALERALKTPPEQRPVAVIARTIKGHGVSFMENQLAWHYLPMTAAQYQLAVDEVSQAVRAQLARTLLAHAAEADFAFLTGDLGFMALEELRGAAKERFINAGIAEQNMVSVAAGMARAGLKPWVYSIAPFLYARAFEQIRNDVCMHDLPVFLIGNGGGYAYGVMGPTHHAIEDYGALLGLANLTVYVPAFDADVSHAADRMMARAGPAYLRLGSDEKPEGFVLPPYAPWRRLLSGARATVVVVGALAGGIFAAAQALPEAQRPDLWVLSELPIQPAKIPAELIADLGRSGHLLFVEEHVAHGGAGAALVHALVAGGLAPRRFTHRFARGYPSGTYGSQRHHRRESGLDPSSILELAAETP